MDTDIEIIEGQIHRQCMYDWTLTPECSLHTRPRHRDKVTKHPLYSPQPHLRQCNPVERHLSLVDVCLSVVSICQTADSVTLSVSFRYGKYQGIVVVVGGWG